MTDARPGAACEAEIAEQPAVWRRLAGGAEADRLRAALVPPVTFVGSGSSFHVADAAARWARATGIDAFALPATEASADRPPFASATVVAFSQSGRSADVVDAMERLAPARRVAVTNDAGSPLGALADVVVSCGAGPERAVPATKSVTAMLVLARLATLPADGACADALRACADATAAWLAAPSPDLAALVAAAAAARAIVVAGSGEGVPAAREIALKLKEAAYRAAEGVAAGEFRHGGIALFDPGVLLVRLGDDAPAEALARAAVAAGAPHATLGAPAGLGPAVPGAFRSLGWIVAGQRLALDLSRALGIDADAPRGIAKVVV